MARSDGRTLLEMKVADNQTARIESVLPPLLVASLGGELAGAPKRTVHRRAWDGTRDRFVFRPLDRRLESMKLSETSVPAMLFAANCVMFGCACASAGTINVTINVETEHGVPLESAPVEVYAPTDLAFAMTDAKGMATVSLDVEEGATTVSAWLHNGTRTHHSLDPTTQTNAINRFTDYTTAYAFERVVEEPIDQVDQSAAVTLTGYDVVKVTGQITRAQQEPDEVYPVWVRGQQFVGLGKVQEPFEYPVLRRGVAAELFINNAPLIHSVALTAAQTQGDIDLGAIALPSLAEDSPLNLTMHNTQIMGPGVDSLDDGVTLVKSDGQLILCYTKDESGKVVYPWFASEDNVPSIPAGDYYVAPGLYNGKLQLMLLDLVRQNAYAILDAHSVPKVTAGGPAVTVNAQEAMDAILAAHFAATSP